MARHENVADSIFLTGTTGRHLCTVSVASSNSAELIKVLKLRGVCLFVVVFFWGGG